MKNTGISDTQDPRGYKNTMIRGYEDTRIQGCNDEKYRDSVIHKIQEIKEQR